MMSFIITFMGPTHWQLRFCSTVCSCQKYGNHQIAPAFVRWINQALFWYPKKTSYRKLPWSHEAAKFVLIIVRSLWSQFCEISMRCDNSNYQSRDFTRSYDKMSSRILKRGPVIHQYFSVMTSSFTYDPVPHFPISDRHGHFFEIAQMWMPQNILDEQHWVR